MLEELRAGWQRFWALPWKWKGPAVGVLAVIVLGVAVPSGDDSETTSSPEANSVARDPTPAATAARSESTLDPTAVDEETATPSPTVTRTIPPEPTPSVPTGVPQDAQPASVSRVVDGDTIDVLLDGQVQRVRLILIDTPEVFGGEECYGPEASAFTKSVLPVGATVYLQQDVSETDRFDRLLRYVYLDDGRMVNELIVHEGYAQVSTFPPDVRYVDRMLAAQGVARSAGSGLWTACVAIPTGPSPTASPNSAAQAGCDPSYPDVCIPPFPPDLDCGEITERRFQVLPRDPHGFDGDNDGIGCES